MKNLGCLVPCVLFLAGCASGLQLHYVEAMEATYKAISLDVKAGIYKPDSASLTTLAGWEKANKDAREALEAEGKATK